MAGRTYSFDAMDEKIFNLIREEQKSEPTQQQIDQWMDNRPNILDGNSNIFTSFFHAFVNFAKRISQMVGSFISGDGRSTTAVGTGLGFAARDTITDQQYTETVYDAATLYEGLTAMGGVFAQIATKASSVRPHAPGTPHQYPTTNPNSILQAKLDALPDPTPRELSLNKPRYASADVTDTNGPGITPGQTSAERNRA